MSKIKYSVTFLQNEKAINALFHLYNLQDLLKSKDKVVIKPSELEKDVIKPLEKLFLSKVEHSVNRSSHLQVQKDVSPVFIRIYRKLEDKGADLSGLGDINKEKKASQIDAYKMMNIYVKHLNLKMGNKSKTFALDNFLKNCFDEEILLELYSKNNSEVITQGQLQKLASLLFV